MINLGQPDGAALDRVNLREYAQSAHLGKCVSFETFQHITLHSLHHELILG
jgi:hypothetical protein